MSQALPIVTASAVCAGVDTSGVQNMLGQVENQKYIQGLCLAVIFTTSALVFAFARR